MPRAFCCVFEPAGRQFSHVTALTTGGPISSGIVNPSGVYLTSKSVFVGGREGIYFIVRNQGFPAERLTLPQPLL